MLASNHIYKDSTPQTCSRSLNWIGSWRAMLKICRPRWQLHAARQEKWSVGVLGIDGISCGSGWRTDRQCMMENSGRWMGMELRELWWLGEDNGRLMDWCWSELLKLTPDDRDQIALLESSTNWIRKLQPVVTWHLLVHCYFHLISTQPCRQHYINQLVFWPALCWRYFVLAFKSWRFYYCNKMYFWVNSRRAKVQSHQLPLKD